MRGAKERAYALHPGIGYFGLVARPASVVRFRGTSVVLERRLSTCERSHLRKISSRDLPCDALALAALTPHGHMSFRHNW